MIRYTSSMHHEGARRQKRRKGGRGVETKMQSVQPKTIGRVLIIANDLIVLEPAVEHTV